MQKSLSVIIYDNMLPFCRSWGDIQMFAWPLAPFLIVFAAQVGFSRPIWHCAKLGGILLIVQPLALQSADHSQCFICQIHPNTFPNYIAAPKCRYWKISQRPRPHLWRCWGAWTVHYGFMRITQRWHSGSWAGKHVVMRFKCSITTAVQAMLGWEHKMLLSTLHMLESSRQKRRISSGLTSSLVP